MIRTAEQIMADLGPEPVRTYPAVRRSRLLPVMVCINYYRGCTGRTKEKGSGLGYCRNCYSRRHKHGDSWYHAPDMRKCRRPDCFMRGTEGHP